MTPTTPKPLSLVDRLLQPFVRPLVIAKDGNPTDLGRSVLRTIIAPSNLNTWRNLGMRGYTPETVRTLLDSRYAGSTMLLTMQMFAAMEDSWPKLGSNLHEVKSVVQTSKFEVMPFSEKGKKPTAKAQEKAQFIERAFSLMKGDPTRNENGFSQTVYDICDALG